MSPACSPALTDPVRLAALAETGLMDSLPEPRFDRWTSLVGQLLGAPVALLSLVDGQRQFFKSSAGLEGWAADARGTSLTHSFCQHVVDDEAPMVVQDARLDDRVCRNLAIGDLGVVAYLGVPVRAAEGQVLGSLCAIHGEPRAWSDEDVRLLEDLASGVSTEIALRVAVRRLDHHATHDELTGLPTRRLLLDRLTGALARSRRTGAAVAVLFCDLDGFKRVNDAHGHQIGDRLLVASAKRMACALRPSDTLARVGGDEFVIVAEAPSGGNDAARLAGRLLAVLQRDVSLSDHSFRCSASIGVTLCGAHDDPEEIVRQADTAMYEAKRNGGGQVRLYDPVLQADALQRLDIERRLQMAVAASEIGVAFQPIVDVSDGTIVGVEALARWTDPELGEVPPLRFVEVAEKTGIIHELGLLVLRRGCETVVRLNEQGPRTLRLSVNLSARQLSRRRLAADVGEILHSTGLPAHLLALELTESALVEQEDQGAAVVEDLRRLGVTIVMDDFGTGFASLSQLRRLPIDAVKVDRSFVSGLGEHADDEAIVAAVIGLGRALGLQVCAEGVERAGQMDRLKTLSCDTAQGFLLGRPVTAEAIEAELLTISPERKLA